MLPPDNHVHTQWSWDADAGSMEASCARAVEQGLPSIAFTDHMEFTRWVIAPEGRGVLHRDAAKVGPDLQFDAPPLDVDGYLECLQRCRDRFPGLRILSGVEFGEPHWHPKELRALLDAGAWQRVLGSLHSLELPEAPGSSTSCTRTTRPAAWTPTGSCAPTLPRPSGWWSPRTLSRCAPTSTTRSAGGPPAPGPSSPPTSRRSSAACCARWPGRGARWRSTRSCRCGRRSSGGGTRPEAKRSRSAATRTRPRRWRAISRRPPRWSRRRGSCPAATATTSGAGGHEPRPAGTEGTMSALPARPLGSSGLSVSVLSLGSWRTYERIPRSAGLAVMYKARELGVNFLDDARYNDETGTAPIQ